MKETIQRRRGGKQRDGGGEEGAKKKCPCMHASLAGGPGPKILGCKFVLSHREWGTTVIKLAERGIESYTYPARSPRSFELSQRTLLVPFSSVTMEKKRDAVGEKNIRISFSYSLTAQRSRALSLLHVYTNTRIQRRRCAKVESAQRPNRPALSSPFMQQNGLAEGASNDDRNSPVLVRGHQVIKYPS